MPGCIPPEVPTRMNVSAPALTSSSTAIAALGHPIPVDVTETGTPSSDPVHVSYSRFFATSRAPSKRDAIFAHRPGSPGRSTYRPTSPGRSAMW